MASTEFKCELSRSTLCEIQIVIGGEGGAAFLSQSTEELITTEAAFNYNFVTQFFNVGIKA